MRFPRLKNFTAITRFDRLHSEFNWQPIKKRSSFPESLPLIIYWAGDFTATMGSYDK